MDPIKELGFAATENVPPKFLQALIILFLKCNNKPLLQYLIMLQYKNVASIQIHHLQTLYTDKTGSV